jgi:hypothetical protein
LQPLVTELYEGLWIIKEEKWYKVKTEVAIVCHSTSYNWQHGEYSFSTNLSKDFFQL